MTPFREVLSVLTFWRTHWQPLILGTFLLIGFLGVMFSLLTWGVLLLLQYRKHKTWWAARRNTEQFFRENITAPAIACALLMLLVGCIYWPYQIYAEEHKSESDLSAKNSALEGENRRLAAANRGLTIAVDRKAHYFDRNDALYSNTVYLIVAFKNFRDNTAVQGGNRCSIRISAPKETLDFATTIGELARYVSNCAPSGPDVPGYDPDRDREATSGMIPDEIIFHAVRGDGAADGLFNDLRRYLPVRRVYYGTEADIPRHNVWLQFGNKADWVIKEFRQFQ